jgi:hypothetical protein
MIALLINAPAQVVMFREWVGWLTYRSVLLVMTAR